MDNEQSGRGWMIFAGVALVGAGLLGFVTGNPIASQDPDALFRVDTAHNIIHVLTGLLALGIAMATRGMGLANGLIAFGVLYALVFVALIVDPTLFGIFADAPANGADHVLHGALAIVSLALGYMLRQREPDLRDTEPVGTGPFRGDDTTRDGLAGSITTPGSPYDDRAQYTSRIRESAVRGRARDDVEGDDLDR